MSKISLSDYAERYERLKNENKKLRDALEYLGASKNWSAMDMTHMGINEQWYWHGSNPMKIVQNALNREP